jgi:hypothetical protein
MAATKISVHARFVALGEELVVDHVDQGWCQVFDLDYRGGSGAGQDYLIAFAIVEPITDDEASDWRENHQPGDVAERFRSVESRGIS